MKKIFDIDEEEENFGLLQGYNNNGEDLFFIDFIKEDATYYDKIISNINENNNKPVIRNKYIWLLRYYLHKYGKKGIIPSSLLEVIL